MPAPLLKIVFAFHYFTSRAIAWTTSGVQRQSSARKLMSAAVSSAPVQLGQSVFDIRTPQAVEINVHCPDEAGMLGQGLWTGRVRCRRVSPALTSMPFCRAKLSWAVTCFAGAGVFGFLHHHDLVPVHLPGQGYGAATRCCLPDPRSRPSSWARSSVT